MLTETAGADADDAFGNAVDLVVVHVLLLLVELAKGVQTFRLSGGKHLSQQQLGVDGFQVTPEIVELLADRISGFLCGVLAAADVLQIVLPGAFAVIARLPAIGWIR